MKLLYVIFSYFIFSGYTVTASLYKSSFNLTRRVFYSYSLRFNQNSKVSLKLQNLKKEHPKHFEALMQCHIHSDFDAIHQSNINYLLQHEFLDGEYRSMRYFLTEDIQEYLEKNLTYKECVEHGDDYNRDCL